MYIVARGRAGALHRRLGVTARRPGGGLRRPARARQWTGRGGAGGGGGEVVRAPAGRWGGRRLVVAEELTQAVTAEAEDQQHREGDRDGRRRVALGFREDAGRRGSAVLHCGSVTGRRSGRPLPVRFSGCRQSDTAYCAQQHAAVAGRRGGEPIDPTAERQIDLFFPTWASPCSPGVGTAASTRSPTPPDEQSGSLNASIHRRARAASLPNPPSPELPLRRSCTDGCTALRDARQPEH